MINSQNLRQKHLKIEFTQIDDSNTEPIFDDYGQPLFSAGQIVSEGTYLEVDSNQQVFLEFRGPLPASLNGRRAFYLRVERPWTSMPSNQTVPAATTNSF